MDYTLYFVIRKDKISNTGKSPIYLRYTHKRKWKNIPLKYSINPTFWKDGKDGFLIEKKYPNYNQLRKHMLDFESQIRDWIENYFIENKKYPEVELISNYGKSSELRSTDEENLTLKTLYEKFKDYKKRHFVEKSTMDIYGYTWDKWTLFENITFKRELKDMNEGTLNEFKLFLMNQGLQKNSIGKYIKTLKTFLNYISNQLEIPVPPSFKRVVTDREDKKDFQILTKTDLEKLKREVFFSRFFDLRTLELNERQILIGRIMIFLCSSGLSFVDYDKLTIDDIFVETDELTKEKFVNIKIPRQKLKTTEDCVIPVLDITIDLLFDMMGVSNHFMEHDHSNPTPFLIKMTMFEHLLNKRKNGDGIKDYHPRIFPKVLVQDFNREIKELLCLIGINDLICVKKLVKGKLVKEYIPKYKLISSHTGRRTYITLCLDYGISPHILMETTGHKKIGTLLRYNKKSELSINKEFQSKIKSK